MATAPIAPGSPPGRAEGAFPAVHRSPRPRVVPRALPRAALSGVVGALLAVLLFGSVTASVSAFSVRLEATLGTSGVTELRVPPLGQVWAKTHRGPLVLRATLTSLDPDRVRELVSGEERDTASIVAAARRELVAATERLVAWVFALAALGGGLLALLVHGLFGRPSAGRPAEQGAAADAAGGHDAFARGAGDGSGATGGSGSRPAPSRAWLRQAAVGAAAGVFAIGLLAGWTYATFDRDAFRAPRYEGALTAAPWVVGVVDEGIAKAQELGRQLSRIADNMGRLFGSVGPLETASQPAPGDVAVLLVSDLHTNPVGIDLVERVANSFHPDFILDAGDLDDYGTALEGTFLARLGGMGVPYVIVPGNHDSPVELAQLRSLPNVRILEDGFLTLDGVTVAGAADPSSRRSGPAVASPQELRAQEARLAGAVAAARHEGTPATIAAAHIPGVVLPLAGEAPVLVAGHTHRAKIESGKGSLYLNPGSTGAAGIRGLASQDAPPYSLMILYLKRDASGRLAPSALDVLEVAHDTGNVRMERRVFPVDLGDVAPDGSGEGGAKEAVPPSEETAPGTTPGQGAPAGH